MGGGGDLILWKLGGNLNPNFSFECLLGNLFFVQTVFTPTFGTNPPLWSLSYEFWYYLLWPIFLLFFAQGAAKKVFSVFVVVAAIIIAPEIMKLFPLWIFGAILRLIPRRDISWWVLILVLCAFGVSTIYGTWANNILGEYLVGICFGSLIVCWTNIDSSIPSWIRLFWQRISLFTFSLYAIHYPIMKVVLLMLNQHTGLGIRRSTADLQDWFVVVAVMLFLTLCGWCSYLMFERHTNQIRKYFKKCSRNICGT